MKWLSHPFNATSILILSYFHTAAIRLYAHEPIKEARLWLLALQCVDLPSLSMGFVPQNFVPE